MNFIPNNIGQSFMLAATVIYGACDGGAAAAAD